MTTETRPREAVRCCGSEEIDHLARVAGPDSTDEVSRIAAAFKALGDETRLRILRALLHYGGELCECEIVPVAGLSQPTVSYHLKVLREAGLVEVERRGVWGYYRARPKALLGLVGDLAEIG
ncbi:MAG TPA: metalloregulator ArsR/SmtB family transcription factor [Dehalococcoidia bacterium]|nr:metalloregulator ArsR/SmtB family transcription factor [Dehalococcoidia bacterium]